MEIQAPPQEVVLHEKEVGAERMEAFEAVNVGFEILQNEGEALERRVQKGESLTDREKQIVSDLHITRAGIQRLTLRDDSRSLPNALPTDTFVNEFTDPHTSQSFSEDEGIPVDTIQDALRRKIAQAEADLGGLDRDPGARASKHDEIARLQQLVDIIQINSTPYDVMHRTSTNKERDHARHEQEAHWHHIDMVAGKPLRNRGDAVGDWEAAEAGLAKRREFTPPHKDMAPHVYKADSKEKLPSISPLAPEAPASDIEVAKPGSTSSTTPERRGGWRDLLPGLRSKGSDAASTTDPRLSSRDDGSALGYIKGLVDENQAMQAKVKAIENGMPLDETGKIKRPEPTETPVAPTPIGTTREKGTGRGFPETASGAPVPVTSDPDKYFPGVPEGTTIKDQLKPVIDTAKVLGTVALTAGARIGDPVMFEPGTANIPILDTRPAIVQGYSPDRTDYTTQLPPNIVAAPAPLPGGESIIGRMPTTEPLPVDNKTVEPQFPAREEPTRLPVAPEQPIEKVFQPGDTLNNLARKRILEVQGITNPTPDQLQRVDDNLRRYLMLQYAATNNIPNPDQIGVGNKYTELSNALVEQTLQLYKSDPDNPRFKIGEKMSTEEDIAQAIQQIKATSGV